MIYIFGEGRNLSVIYDGSILTEEQKQGGFAVEILPPKETPEGYYAILIKEGDTLRWEYEEIIEEELEEVKIEE
jgi:hypothetical protein